MKHDFTFDTRGLPPALKGTNAQEAWSKAVNTAIANLGLPYHNDDRVSAATYATIKGMLLLDQQFDPVTAEFLPQLRSAWLETLGSTANANGASVANKDMYAQIADIIATMQKVGDEKVPILFQQFAYVNRYAVTHAGDVPVNSQLFASEIRVALDQYVAGPPPTDTLDIPELTGAAVQDAQIDASNISAFATVYAIAQLEEMKSFYTVDRLTEDFLNGVLATQYDAGGRLLDTWFWKRRDRMTEAERRSIYSRMLGMTGGEVAREVQPNTDFNDRFMGFLSAIAEFDRQQRISDLFSGNFAGNRTSNLTMTMENVRQKGHDLAANMSVYGWGYAHYGARRLNADFTAVLEILKNPVIQKLLGVSTPYQVIERRCIADFGKSPDIVRLRTMADAGKRIIDLIAKNAQAWSGSTGHPLFPDLNAVAVYRQNAAAGVAVGPSDISLEDTDELIRQTQFWLAVNGIQYEDLDQRSKPKLNAYEPSLPAYGGGIAPGGVAGGAGSAMDKIKQMVSSGQTPTLDQLKSILPGGFGNS